MSQAVSVPHRSWIVTLTGVYFVILSLLSAAGGIFTLVVASIGFGHGTSQSAVNAIWIPILMGLFLGVYFMLGAVGLFRRMKWARWYTVLMFTFLILTAAFFVIAWLIGGAGGDASWVIGVLIWIAVNSFGLYRFLMDERIKLELSN